MFIRCRGARGSIPVSGKEYLKYGGSTTCLEVRTKDDEVIMIDAGSGIRKLGNKLLTENRRRYNIIFTHAHWDHILGFPLFKPIYLKGMSIELFGCPFAQDSAKQIISSTMTRPHFPIKLNDIESKIIYHGACDKSFSIKSMKITPILLSHPNQGIGYKFVEDGKTFVFLTDNELAFKHPGGLDYKDYLEFSSAAYFLIHDAEFAEEEYKLIRRWGHTVYKDALKLALEAKVKKFGLFHHNQESNDTAVDEIVKDCQRIINENKASLECFAVPEGMEVTL